MMSAPRDPVTLLWSRIFELAAREAVRLVFGPGPVGPQPGARLKVAHDAGTLRPYATLGVLPTAPRAVIEAAYRALAKAEHPDTGGSVERMRALNAAIAAIRKERRWKG